MRHNQISRQNKNKKIKYLAIGLAAGVLGIGSAAGVLTSVAMLSEVHPLHAGY
ncbi:MAG: hypothetical protein ACLVBP_09995 [Ruminococcus sp.]